MSAYDPKHHEWLSIIPFQEQTIIVAEPGLECVVKPLHRNDAICAAAFHTKVYVSDTFLISNRNLGTMEATTHTALLWVTGWAPSQTAKRRRK
jgi:hypothetical protein